MKFAKIPIFTIDELGEHARERALQKAALNIADWEYNEIPLENAAKAAESLGIINPVFSYCGFWCQGDGAGLSKIDSIDFEQLVKGLAIVPTRIEKFLNENFVEVFWQGHREGNYEHGKFSYEIFIDGTYYPRLYDAIENAIEKIIEELNDRVNDIRNRLYRELQDNYYECTDEKNLMETFREYETLFYEDGRVFSWEGDIEEWN